MFVLKCFFYNLSKRFSTTYQNKKELQLLNYQMKMNRMWSVLPIKKIENIACEEISNNCNLHIPNIILEKYKFI